MPDANAQMSTNYLSLDQQICFPLYAASNIVVRAYRSLLKPLGLSYPQYLAMLVLWEQSPISVGELGERLYLDTGTLTPMLKRMESAGLLTRTRSREDERRVDIELTEQGRALKADAQSIPEALFCRLAADPKWLESLRGDVKKLIHLMGEGDNAP